MRNDASALYRAFDEDSRLLAAIRNELGGRRLGAVLSPELCRDDARR
jgi:hypothetical protein